MEIHKKKQRINEIAIIIVLLLIVMVTFSVKQFDVVTKLDLSGIHFVQQLLSKFPVSIPVFISNFGYEQYMLIPLLIAGFIMLWGRKFKDFLILMFATEISYLLALIVKNIVQRPRPSVTLWLIKENGFSFVSGHSLVNTCFYGLLILFTLKYIKNPWIKYPLIAIFSLIILSVGLSRVWLGVHYPTDVMGGFLLGLLFILIISRLGI